MEENQRAEQGKACPECLVIQEELFKPGTSRVKRYMELIVGSDSAWDLLKYEAVTWLATHAHGAAGIWLRSKLYPRIMSRVGRNVLFGYGVTLRHPSKISIGDNVAIDDNCLLDAKGEDNRGIAIGSNCFVGRNTIIACKHGDIEIGDGTNISFNCEVLSGGSVKIGKNALIAAYCYIIGGTHGFERTDLPVQDQDRECKGIVLGDNVWLGAGVKVLDGVTIGANAVIGAGAVVTKDVPEYSVAVGIPATVVKSRK